MSKNKKAVYRNYRTYTKEIPTMKTEDINKKVATGCGVIVDTLIALLFTIFLTPLFLMLTWNLAVCAVFPSLAPMGYWVAFGVNWFLGIVGNKFAGGGVSADFDKIKNMLNSDGE